MSDTQDKTDFGGIPRADTSSPIDNESHTDSKLQDLTEQDTTLYEKNFKNRVLKDQSEETNKNVSVEESENFEQENDTKEDLNNEMEDFLKRDKMDDIQKKIELVTPNEINLDVQSLELGNAFEETGKSSEVNANLSKTSGPMTDSWRTDSAVSLSDHEVQVEDNNSSGSTTDDGEVQVVKDLPSSGSTTDDEILVLEDSPSAGSSTDEEDVKVVEGYTEKQHLNPTSDVKSSAEEMESKGEQRPVLVEHGTVKEDDNVPQGTQVTDEGILDSVSSSISELTSSRTSAEIFPENSAVLQSIQVLEGTDQNSNSGNNAKVSEMVNAGTSAENYVDEFKVSQSTQVTEGTVDEENFSTRDYSKRVENPERSEGTTKDTADVEISNHQESPPKAERRTSQQVAEIISQHLNSEEFNKKLSEINDIVKELTAVEFISPNLSLEDQETLNKVYGQKDPLEENIDWETQSEVSESNTPKRKSKESPELDEDEQLQAIAKKCKLSRQALAGNICLDCLEEQFRVASEQSNEGQSQREKIYEFPVTESGEYQERRYKLCKHHIAKLDAMVVSAMTMENYLSQLNNEMSAEDYSRNEFLSGKSTVLDSQSTIPKSGSSSARTRSFNKKNVTLQQSSVINKEISQPNEKLAGVEENSKGYVYLGICKAFNYIKNLVLFVSFTGSLTIAITVAKIFGVTFPVPKSQRNLRNDSECSLQDFPDV